MTYTHCCVYSTKTPDDGQKTCPKHVYFYFKNKFQKLVHLVGFIIRLYYDARSSECQSLERNASRTFGRAIITLPQLCTFSTSLHWSSVAWRPWNSRHCPAVFFSHLGLSALSFPQWKIGGAFRKKCYFFLRKSEAAYKQRRICTSILFRCLI